MNCFFRSKGDEFDDRGWPSLKDVEPVNETARTIYDYAKRHAHDAWRPDAPIDGLLNDYFLPAVTTPEADFILDVQPAPKDAPLYAASRDIVRGGRVLISEGTTICWLGWPRDRLLEPANEFAEQVTTYFEANEKNPKLLRSPWCEFRQALVLPELPQTKIIFKRSEFGASERLPEGGEYDHDGEAGSFRKRKTPAPAPRASRRSMRRVV